VGIDTADLAEGRTLNAVRPGEAPRLAGGSFVSSWLSMDSERAGLSCHGTHVDSQARPCVEEGYGGGLIAGYRCATTPRLLWAAVDGRSAPHGPMLGVTQ